MTKVTIPIFFIIITSTFCHATEKVKEVHFHYSHSKAKKCVQSWLAMEKLLNTKGVRCQEVLPIKGFPYLRGNRNVLSLAPKISTKYAAHRWLELLRRIDLQARYAELSALSKNDLKSFCSEVGIRNCIQGRIRAYVAHCSAIIMGDEKSNHDFLQVLKKNAELSAQNRRGTAKCFDNTETLDGIAGQDVLNSIFAPPGSFGGSSTILQKRIMLQKATKPY